MSDLARVGIVVDDSGAVRIIKDLGDVSSEASDKITRLENTSRRSSRAHGEHALATGKVSRALEGLVLSTVGANHHLGQLSVALSDMALGAGVVTGVLAGLGAIALVYDTMTEGARKAKEEADKFTQSLVEQARAAQAATVAGSGNLELIAQTNLESVKKESGFGVSSFVQSLLSGRLSFSDSDLEAQSKRIADAKTAVEQATVNWGKAWQDASDKASAAIKKLLADMQEAARKAAADAKQYNDAIAQAVKATNDIEFAKAKNRIADAQARQDADDLLTAARQGAIAFQDQQDAIEVRNRLQSEGITVFDAEYDARKRSLEIAIQERHEAEAINRARDEAAQKAKEDAQRAADEAERPFKNMIRELQQDFASFFDDIFTKGVKSFKDLFSAIRDMFLKLVAELAAAALIKRLGGSLSGLLGQLSGAASSGLTLGQQAAQRAAGAAIGGAAIGFGLGQMSGSATGGAVAGAASGAAFGAATAGPLGAAIGGLTGLVSGLLGGASAAREAAAAMRQLQKDFEAGMAAFRHDDLAQALADIASQAEKLRQALSKLNGFDSFLQQFFGITTPALASQQAAIAAQEERNRQQAIQNAANQARYAQEDLEVRNLRATGHGDEADTLAFKEQQQREYETAQMKALADGIITADEQLYLNTLQTTLNNEAIARQNGLLETLTRNAPSGFFVNSYLSEFADRTQVPDPFGTGIIPPNYPINTEPPGTGSAGTSGLNPPGSRTAPSSHISMTFEEGAVQINGDRSGDEMLADFVDALQRRAAATVGVGGTLSQALDTL